MIDIATLTDKDVGRGVVYRANHAGAKPEDGVITSWNAIYIFVSYRVGTASQATYPKDLEWTNP